MRQSLLIAACCFFIFVGTAATAELMLQGQNGALLSLEGDIMGASGESAEVILEARPSYGWHNAKIRRNCSHGLNPDIVYNGVRSVFRSHGLKIAYGKTAVDHVIVVSQPVLSGSKASFYAYTAQTAACTTSCRLRVAADYVHAPVRDRVILLRDAIRSDDAVTGYLIDAAEAEFDKCGPA
jgi:hypothetical protein